MSESEKRLFAEDPLDPQKSSKQPETGFETVHFEANQVIFEEGDEGDAAYLILKGQVEIRKGMKTSNPQPLALLKKNDIFGEMALFDNRPRMAEAMARTSVELIAIKRDEFHRRLETIDPVIRTISLYLVGRVRAMADQFMKRKDTSWSSWKKD